MLRPGSLAEVTAGTAAWPAVVRVALATCVIATLLAPSAVAQQRSVDTGVLVRADPGIVINGRVATAIYTTMRVAGSYGRPVPRVPLLVIDSLGQRMALATDDAGTLTVMLVPGRYRVVTTQPVTWNRHEYEWDIRLDVAEGMPIFDLTQANSTRAVAAPSGRLRSSPVVAGLTP